MRTRHESPGRGSHRTAPGPGPFGTCGPIVSRLHAPRQDRVPSRLIRTTIDAAAKRVKLVPLQTERCPADWHIGEPGDEVVLLLPNYMEGWGLIQMFGGKVRPLWLREDLGWQFDSAELATLVNRRTKAIAVCNPNNPTGAVMAEAQRRA